MVDYRIAQDDQICGLRASSVWSLFSTQLKTEVSIRMCNADRVIELDQYFRCPQIILHIPGHRDHLFRWKVTDFGLVPGIVGHDAGILSHVRPQ